METSISRTAFPVSLCCFILLAGVQTLAGPLSAQTSPEAPARSVEHVLGTITEVDAAAHTVTVKDDKSSAESVISTANTKTLIKVLPGAKDLKGAARITAEDLAIGDRVDVRGFKEEASPNTIAARSIVLMSARELQAKHQADAAAWQSSTAGIVRSVDPSTRSIAISAHTPRGLQPITVQVPASAELTRYSPDTPKTPVQSQFTDIQVGDQVRIIGNPAADGSSLTAERLYSGAFRTVAGTVLTLNPDGRGFTLRNLQTKQPLQIALTDSSTLHKLPPEMAAIAARRLNAGAGGPQPPAAGGPAAESQTPDPAPGGGQPPAAGARPHQRGDLAQMLQHLPTVPLSDLKPGDAVIVSGVFNNNQSQLTATTVVAGVEPILQSPAGRTRESQGLGEWSLDMAVPNQ